MNTNEFRAEVTKIMPGYKWTVKRPYKFKNEDEPTLTAVGIQSAGFNRTSTLEVERVVEDNGVPMYTARIADFGTRGPWVETCKGVTIARALRSLQESCEAQRALFAGCVSNLEFGRNPL